MTDTGRTGPISHARTCACRTPRCRQQDFNRPQDSNGLSGPRPSSLAIAWCNQAAALTQRDPAAAGGRLWRAGRWYARAGGVRSVGGLESSPAVFDAGILATIAGACLAQVSPSWTHPHELRTHDPSASVHEAGVAVKKSASRAVGDWTGFRSCSRGGYSSDGGWGAGRAGEKHSQDGGDDQAAHGSSPLAASSALAACYNSRSAATLT